MLDEVLTLSPQEEVAFIIAIRSLKLLALVNLWLPLPLMTFLISPVHFRLVICLVTHHFSIDVGPHSLNSVLCFLHF